MRSEHPDLVRTLLAQSLTAWRIDGHVAPDGDGAVSISRGDTRIRVETSPPDVPFRWLVTVDGRRRGAVSLVAVLRQVRGALDPGYAKARVRIASPVGSFRSDT